MFSSFFYGGQPLGMEEVRELFLRLWISQHCEDAECGEDQDFGAAGRALLDLYMALYPSEETVGAEKAEELFFAFYKKGYRLGRQLGGLRIPKEDEISDEVVDLNHEIYEMLFSGSRMAPKKLIVSLAYSKGEADGTSEAHGMRYAQEQERREKDGKTAV